MEINQINNDKVLLIVKSLHGKISKPGYALKFIVKYISKKWSTTNKLTAEAFDIFSLATSV